MDSAQENKTQDECSTAKTDYRPPAKGRSKA